MPREHASIDVQGTTIDLFNDGTNNSDFISLTGIAKYKSSDAPADLIKNWLRNRSTLEFLGIWEQMNNSNFNNKLFTQILSEAGANSFIMSPKKWITLTQATGITSQPGRYGGTYAHSDIAFEFASWISPEFRLYLIKDYQQLKRSSESHFNLDWTLNRALSKANYLLHTDAIRETLIPQKLTSQEVKFTYANEADRLNIALFGVTASEWRTAHPDSKGNIRDNATIEQLLVLTNLENLNAQMILDKVSNEVRTKKLNDIARHQLQTFIQNKTTTENIRRIEKNK
ncbi:KilA-N domain-containing protein [Lactiplantibacillus mudanjiangensis]|uniref:DNA-binding protein [Lactobacillus plantarum] n=1 Tax=Lactiplantibacillus mudanjiangensis TaxID=1296538 RepID=A0A660E2M0_9LACO|nr:KilA-N domain-containing protein [Lactiplantibacillus mudanjiangensis]VDG22431.1 DNA-binding protein [Lactobacillus plantarum] [Lactiplantibacillus mudanjiangensis]VDG27033.1 DNA-binding protein [Lactobacillus plantarum] [Lactiplantibacillus mudanjiangensis]VDG32130.1 DNA-binding protein [Lactobacillus plantarum] [Lactiplantibacillus mudanjiangensis]